MSRIKNLSRSDFSQVARGRGRREHGKLFSLVCGTTVYNSGDIKVACVVSAKAASLAVDRNLIKRRCKTVAREMIKQAAAANAYVFYAKPPARTATFGEIRHDIISLLGKIK